MDATERGAGRVTPFGSAIEDAGDDRGDEGPESVVTLKNGRRMEIREVFATWETLKSTQLGHPSLFAAVLRLARGETVRPIELRRLRRATLASSSGGLQAGVRDVLVSAFTVTSEGPVLGNPIRFTGDADRNAFRQCEQRYQRNIERILIDRDDADSQ